MQLLNSFIYLQSWLSLPLPEGQEIEVSLQKTVYRGFELPSVRLHEPQITKRRFPYSESLTSTDCE